MRIQPNVSMTFCVDFFMTSELLFSDYGVVFRDITTKLLDTNPVCLLTLIVVCPSAEFHFAIPAIPVIACIEIHCGIAYLGQSLCEI